MLKLIDTGEDSVRLYRFCLDCGSKLEIHGQGKVTEDPRWAFIDNPARSVNKMHASGTSPNWQAGNGEDRKRPRIMKISRPRGTEMSGGWQEVDTPETGATGGESRKWANQRS